jgi:uncharacterized protein (DUF58 family)
MLEVILMKLVDVVIRWVPAVIAVCSLVLLYAFSRIDSIIHQTLYAYGLQFSYDWATPYWNTAWVALAMGWLIVVLAVVFQAYLLFRKTPASAVKMPSPELKDENHWSTFRLGDGTTIKVKLVVKGARRLNKFEPDGTPMYAVDTENEVQVVDVPEALKVRD